MSMITVYVTSLVCPKQLLALVKECDYSFDPGLDVEITMTRGISPGHVLFATVNTIFRD